MRDLERAIWFARERQKTWSEKFWIWVAWRLPRKLVYWCAIRVGVKATTGYYGNTSPPELSFPDALKRWDKP